MDKRKKRLLMHELEAGAGGAVTGAVIGSFAGAPGAVVGGVIGAATGAVAIMIGEREQVSASARDAELDREIGVTEGGIGAPNLEHPPESRGARYPSVSPPVETRPGDEALTSLGPDEPGSWFEGPATTRTEGQDERSP